MGKRSSFERVERDFYPTPIEAVFPLSAHLADVSGFYEPCAGDGRLSSHLVSLGIEVRGQLDIEPMHGDVARGSAFDLCEDDLRGASHIITNPPWDRKILHPMIEHFSSMRPTWLLFDADWMHTKQSAQFMPRLRKIVSVGRVKWIPDSKMTGKDNCAWHLFGAPSDEPAIFYGRVK